MPRIILASNNAHKITELAAILAQHQIDLQVVPLRDLGDDIPEIIEDGQTFEENALKKVMAITPLAPDDFVLADDSGLTVDALNGEPGVYSARYAGDHDDAANIDKVLAKLGDNPDRTAHFHSVLVLAGPGRDNLVAKGQVTGVMTHERHGEGGFGYDPIFWVPGFNKTFAELTAAEKNQVSHRGLALQDLVTQLPNWLKGASHD